MNSASGSQLERFLKGFVVYVAVGSPIGGLVFWLEGIVLFPSKHDGRAVDLLIVFVLFSYAIGLIPSAVVGSIVAFLNVRWRGLNWAGVAAIVLVPILAIIAWGYATSHPPSLGDSVALILVFLIPTLVCWRIVRRWRTQPEGI